MKWLYAKQYLATLITQPERGDNMNWQIWRLVTIFKLFQFRTIFARFCNFTERPCTTMAAGLERKKHTKLRHIVNTNTKPWPCGIFLWCLGKFLRKELLKKSSCKWLYLRFQNQKCVFALKSWVFNYLY